MLDERPFSRWLASTRSSTRKSSRNCIERVEAFSHFHSAVHARDCDDGQLLDGLICAIKRGMNNVFARDIVPVIVAGAASGYLLGLIRIRELKLD